MKEKILLEYIFSTRTLRNALILDNSKKNLSSIDYIMSEIQKKNGNIWYSVSDEKKLIQKYNVKKLKSSSSQILSILNNKNIKMDIIYITSFIEDFEYVLKNILDKNGIFICKNSEIPNYINLNFELVYSDNDFSVYQQKNLEHGKLILEDISKRIKYTYLKYENKKENKQKYIGIGILTYNHENYVKECLDSVFKQEGNFKLKIVIVDDCSLDNTVKIIDSYLKKNSKNINVEFIKNNTNKGAINSLKIMLKKFRNTDYFTFCEGDDYWNSSLRIQNFINYMEVNKNVSVAFNSFYILNDNDKIIKKNSDHIILDKEFFLTSELIEGHYFIGNLGCCFYDSFFLQYFDENLFQLPLYDFFLNTYYSTFGLIGHLKEFLSTYRIHTGSFWSSLKSTDKNYKLSKFIDRYNNYFNYIYNYEYESFQNTFFYNKKYKYPEFLDLIIIDNIFPNSLSPFSYEEITNYLYNIEKSVALCTYLYTASLNDETLRTGLKKYKQANPKIAHKVSMFTKEKALRLNSKLMYFIFKSTTMYYYDLLKEKKSNFIFELYPGGGFFFNDSQCDADLRKIMKLKGFKKVIVTQEPVRQYLLDKKLCKKNQIEMIFGVVMDNKAISKKSNNKSFYGKNKETCDIVFMAHKYHSIGKDKGYDLFIETAKCLYKKYKNIRFHVVGNFDKNVINIEEIKNNIQFYGPLEKDCFDNFFSDKDMIISPNRPGILANGAFDGFPTASCTEAGIREVVMLCTDPFNMHENYYKPDVDIVIIKDEVEDIVKKVEMLYNHPEKIEQIAKKSRKKIIDLYSYNSQIKPRLNLINKIINKKGI